MTGNRTAQDWHPAPPPGELHLVEIEEVVPRVELSDEFLFVSRRGRLNERRRDKAVEIGADHLVERALDLKPITVEQHVGQLVVHGFIDEALVHAPEMEARSPARSSPT